MRLCQSADMLLLLDRFASIGGGWLFVTFVTRPDMFCSKSQGNHTNVVTTTIHTQGKGIIIIIMIIIIIIIIIFSQRFSGGRTRARSVLRTRTHAQSRVSSSASNDDKRTNAVKAGLRHVSS